MYRVSLGAIRRWAISGCGGLLALLAMQAAWLGCAGTTDAGGTTPPPASERTPPPLTVGPTAPVQTPSPSALLLLNQHWIEGNRSSGFDLEDIDEVFWFVFSNLPDDVTVYPSENYYYFIVYTGGRQIWGNVRLPAGRRDRGVLSFAYFEYKESPYVIEPRIEKSKFYTEADGLIITKDDDFTYTVRYNRRDVVFHLHRLPQDPPRSFRLDDDETFVMRTFDESGYQFFLLFNHKRDYLFWVLNEEDGLPDHLVPAPPDSLIGRRSGFVFYVDSAHDNRKLLAAIRGANATVNNYYDGPFDQLADNYVDQTNIAEYLQRASPTLRGRIDKYGYYTDREASSRVAVSPYYVYFSDADLAQFMKTVRTSDDPAWTISQKGREPVRPFPTPYPTPSPTPYRFPTPSPTPFVPATPTATSAS